MRQDRNTFFLLVLGLGLTALALFFAFSPNSASFLRLPLGGKSVTGGINSSLPASEFRNEDTGVLPSINSSLPLSESHDPLEPIAEFLKKQGLPAPPLALGGKKPVSSSQSQKNSAPPAKPLTEQEIFSKLWHPDYIRAMRKMENLLVRDGFVKEAERRQFSKDEDFLSFFPLVVDYIHMKGWIREDEFERYKRVVLEVVPRIVRDERNALTVLGRSSGVSPGYQNFTATRKDEKSPFKDFIDGLAYAAFLANPANASWVREPDCYKDDDPNYNVEGFNEPFVFCCNCGFLEEEFVEDCGENSSGCDEPLGCLNLICEEWPNAIWDRLDYPWGGTGICGCG